VSDKTQGDELRFYAVKNKDGQWFRRKGYGGGGESWVDKLSQARIYTKPGGARAVASWYANRYPGYGVPNLVVFKAVFEEEIDESLRVKKEEEREKAREAKRARARAENAKIRAEQALKKAQDDLKKAEEEQRSFEKEHRSLYSVLPKGNQK
jgi:hypothetical protein